MIQNHISAMIFCFVCKGIKTTDPHTHQCAIFSMQSCLASENGAVPRAKPHTLSTCPSVHGEHVRGKMEPTGVLSNQNDSEVKPTTFCVYQSCLHLSSDSGEELVKRAPPKNINQAS